MKSLTVDADHYRKHSSAQFRLAEEALLLHQFCDDEQILDIGCGDGRLTLKLAEKAPRGSVDGIDPSPSMVALAKHSLLTETVSNVNFAIDSAENFRTEKKYDLITAFSSLHWVRGQESALQNMVGALKPNGKILILTYPQESPYQRILEEIIYSEKWRPYADSSACRHWVSSERYAEVISALNLKKHHLKTSREVIFYRDEEHFTNQVKGWLPCLIDLPKHLQKEFLADLTSQVRCNYGKPNQPGFEVIYGKIVLYLEKKEP